ncbi:MAG TPA: hypothetical protein VHD90_19775 [Phototrophicaceae bacterium]|nr:hypothetical protein [Phototrophicaceae bacterium]
MLTPIENLSGHASNVGDFVGNDTYGFNQGVAGSTVGTIGATGGMVIGGIKIGAKAKELGEVNEELEDARERSGNGVEGMRAIILLLERKKAAAQKGIAEGVGSVVGGISGAIGSIAGFFGSATAQVLSKVMGVVGAGIAMVLGTIAAIRDFMNVHKRRKAKKAISLVIDSYAEMATDIGTEFQDKKQELETLTAKPKRSRTEADKERMRKLPGKIAALEQRFDAVDQMRVSLAISKRKQGSKGKILSGITNLVGVGGSAALGVMGLGMLGVLSVGAAAGPVGWALVGAAAVAALAYFIGQKVKQAIRNSNVKRMNEELTLVNEYLTAGTVNGNPLILKSGRDATTLTAEQRLKRTWHRGFFPTLEKKGWFNKLISKSKSGTMTMAERKQELQDYLAKYDKEAAANIVWEGIKQALLTDKGNVEVSNPQHDSAHPDPNIPEKITLRQQIRNLIAFYFGEGEVDKFVESIQGTKREKYARSLLLQKMKLEDK